MLSGWFCAAGRDGRPRHAVRGAVRVQWAVLHRAVRCSDGRAINVWPQVPRDWQAKQSPAQARLSLSLPAHLARQHACQLRSLVNEHRDQPLVQGGLAATLRALFGVLWQVEARPLEEVAQRHQGR
eukprot:722522-Prymnesium_polylepis.2